jgi:hypothetical protein
MSGRDKSEVAAMLFLHPAALAARAPHPDAFFDRSGQIKRAITSPGIKAGFMCCRWFETQLFVIPLQFATRLRMQMNSWRQPA